MVEEEAEAGVVVQSLHLTLGAVAAAEGAVVVEPRPLEEEAEAEEEEEEAAQSLVARQAQRHQDAPVEEDGLLVVLQGVSKAAEAEALQSHSDDWEVEEVARLNLAGEEEQEEELQMKVLRVAVALLKQGATAVGEDALEKQLQVLHAEAAVGALLTHLYAPLDQKIPTRHFRLEHASPSGEREVAVVYCAWTQELVAEVAFRPVACSSAPLEQSS